MTEPQLPNSQPQALAEDEITVNNIFRTIIGLLGGWPYLLFGAFVGLTIAFLVKYIRNRCKDCGGAGG